MNFSVGAFMGSAAAWKGSTSVLPASNERQAREFPQIHGRPTVRCYNGARFFLLPQLHPQIESTR